MAEKKRDWKFGIIATIAFALIFLLYCSTINPELSDLSGDSTLYMMLAKSISQGGGYRDIENPVEPPHIEMMPGLPLLISAVNYFDPDYLRPLKLLMVIFAFGAVISFYLFLFREPGSARIALALLFALIPFLISFQTEILSDLPHLFFLLLGFYFFEKSRSQNSPGILHWILTGLLLAAAFYFRQLAAIAFASGIFIILLSKNLRRINIVFGFGLGFLLPASLWYVRNFMIAGSLEPIYGSKFRTGHLGNPFSATLTLGGMIFRIFKRIWFYNLRLEKAILLAPHWRGLHVVWIILLIFFLIGLGYELIKPKNIAAIFYVPYLVVISGYGIWAPRYLLPLLPLSLYFIFRGLEFALGIVLRKKLAGQMIAAGIIFLWLICNLAETREIVAFQHSPKFYPTAQLMGNEQEAVALIGRKNFAYYPDAFEWKKKGPEYLLAKEAAYYHFFAMAEWAKKNLRAEDVVVCRKPTLFAWQSEGKSMQYPPELDVDQFLDEVKKRGGGYILIEEISPELRPILFSFWKNRPERLKLVKQIGDTFLLSLQ